MKLPELALSQWPHSSTTPPPWQQLSQLLEQLNHEQRLWLSGYLAASSQQNTTPVSQPSPAPQKHLTVLYGSQTGNGTRVARQLQAAAEQAGLATQLHSLADFSAKQLSKHSHVSLIISTHGEGEAPDDAEMFYEQLFGNKAPDLSHLSYSVLALGDSSYEWFCQTGKEIDEQLAKLGGKRMFKRHDCDVDYQDDADQWIEAQLPELKKALLADPNENNITTLPLPGNLSTTANDQQLANRKSPHLAEITAIQSITGRGSSKNTHHIELTIDPEQIQYQPGDSLAILTNNNSQLVTALLNHWQIDADAEFQFKGNCHTIQELLTSQVEITQISKPFIQFMAQHIDDEQLQRLATSHQHFVDYCQNHQLLDLLQQFDPEATIGPQAALNQLKKITPRLYSIASSPAVFEDEVHLTVNLEAPTAAGYHGLASGFLCDRAQVGDEVAVYVEPNDNFRLPENNDTPIIMIGPGTGVAPFRAFLQHRQSQLAKGPHWLVFGNPNFATDFLYQAEWLKAIKNQTLQQLDVAFSRDQEHKIYVQDKLKSQAEQLWQWLQQGAHIYLCGDASRMAKDVEATLISIIAEQGKLDNQAASDYLTTLKRDNRYQKDVY